MWNDFARLRVGHRLSRGFFLWKISIYKKFPVKHQGCLIKEIFKDGWFETSKNK